VKSPLRWWFPILSAVVALGTGFIPYAALNFVGKLPVGLRDRPWPLELVAAAATALTLAFAVRAWREKRLRAVSTFVGGLSFLATAGFVLIVNFGTKGLPPPPKELAVGTVAPDFTLPDENGHAVTLASLRGHPTLLVFYRGFW
jgi:hypothetical protein